MPLPKSAVSKNFLALTVAQAVNIVAPLLTLPYLISVLGSHEFGLYAICQSVIVFLSIFVDYGSDVYGTRKISGRISETTFLANVFWSIQLIKTGILVVVVAPVIWALISAKIFPMSSDVLMASSLSLVGTVLFSQWYLMGIQQTWVIPLSLAVGKSLGVLMVFWWVRDQQDAWKAALINSLSFIATGFICSIIIWRSRWVPLYLPKFREIRISLKEGSSIFFSSALIGIYTTAPVIILGFAAGASVAGIFSAADKVKQAFQIILVPFSQAIFIEVCSIQKTDKLLSSASLSKLSYSQMGAGFLLSLGMASASPLISRHYFGVDMDGSVIVLLLMAPIIFIVSMSNVFGMQTMIPLGMNQQFLAIIAIGAGLNIIATYVLGLVWGAAGGAAALLFTEVAMVVLMYFSIRRRKI